MSVTTLNYAGRNVTKMRLKRVSSWFEPVGVVMRAPPRRVLAAVDAMTSPLSGRKALIEFAAGERAMFERNIAENPRQSQRYALTDGRSLSLNWRLGGEVPDDFFQLNFAAPQRVCNASMGDVLSFWDAAERHLIDQHQARPALLAFGIELHLQEHNRRAHFDLAILMESLEGLFAMKDFERPLALGGGLQCTPKQWQLAAWTEREVRLKNADACRGYLRVYPKVLEDARQNLSISAAEDTDGELSYFISLLKNEGASLSMTWNKTPLVSESDGSPVWSTQRFWHEAGEADQLLKSLASMRSYYENLRA